MPELLNLVGLSAGVVLYAMLLAMVLAADRTARSAARRDPLLVATAVLGLVWNLCALPVYELPKVGIEGPFRLLNVAGLAALGFLPAVVVHSVLRGRRGKMRETSTYTVCIGAYAVSAAAAISHLVAAASDERLPALFGMRLLTYGFVGLVVPVAIATHGQPGARRALWIASLAIFAVSAIHLTQLHTGDSSWPVELIGHHASLPLAFAILYQDYPFALADLFLKRALTLLALVSSAVLAVAAIGAIHSTDMPVRDPRDVGVLVTLWVASALLYPKLRVGVDWFVDHVLLDRPDYGQLRGHIGERIQQYQEIPAMLDEVCAEIAPAVSARVVRWLSMPHETVPENKDDRAAWSTLVDIPVSEPPRFAIEVAGLTGGRRLLSGDRQALDAIALLVGRRVDAIRLARERYERQIREQEIGRLATEAELRALRAQINPHFLFNALTAIGYLIQTAPARALETLMRLTSLLRGILRSDGDLTTLGQELDVIESYLDIERARFEDRLAVTIDVPASLRSLPLPPLVLQPIVENAIKHGISPMRQGGGVTIAAWIDAIETPTLSIAITDTGAGATAGALDRGRREGVGLRNVERRLECRYGASAAVSVTSHPGAGTSVRIRIPVDRSCLDVAGIAQSE